MNAPREATTPDKLRASLRATRTTGRSTTRTMSAAKSIAGEQERPPRQMATSTQARKITADIPKEFLVCRRGHQWDTREADWFLVPGMRPMTKEQRVQCVCCGGWRTMTAIKVQGTWVKVQGYRYEMPEGFRKNPDDPHLTRDDYLTAEINRS